MKEGHLEDVRNDLIELENSSPTYQGIQTLGKEIRNRRSNFNYEEKCCCPPKNLYMPAFITDRKFDEIVEKIRNNTGSN